MSQEFEIHLTDLTRGGAAMGRLETGQVVFVQKGAPGDHVRVRVVLQKKRYLEAEIVSWISRSDQRVEPRCAVFEQCGGCDWQHLPYSLQWETKVRGIRTALSRAGVELDASLPFTEIPATHPWNYRNRIQLRKEGEKLGFFERKSKRLVNIQRCEIADERLNESLAVIRSELRESSKPTKVELEVLPNGEIRKALNRPHAFHGFRQVNDEQNAAMKKWVLGGLSRSPAKSSGRSSERRVLLDLFGGSGNFAFPALEEFDEVHCVDLSVPSPPDQREAVPRLKFHKSNVVDFIRKNPSLKATDAIVDPPREGLAGSLPEIAKGLLAMGVRNLVAIGCDPDAWARDFARWQTLGFQVREIAGVDLFPQTHHVEAVAFFTHERY